jgi:TRAP-type C4-dicarboxylate transport system substrate-binding protein
VQAAGVEVIRPPKPPFREKVNFLKEQFADEPSIDSLIQAIQAVPDPEGGE